MNCSHGFIYIYLTQSYALSFLFPKLSYSFLSVIIRKNILKEVNGLDMKKRISTFVVEMQTNMEELKDKYIRFDWAIKRLLRQKANFGVLEGFLTVKK